MANAWNEEVRGGMEAHKIFIRLNQNTKALQNSNRKVFSYAYHKIRELEQKLEVI